MNASLAGKTAIATGASRGIGAAIARRLATDGADIVITYAGNEAAAAATVAAINATDRRGHAIKANAANANTVRTAIEQASDFLGSIDILVHSAGITEMAAAPGASENSDRRQFGINVDGVFIGTNAAIPLMRDNGRILIVGSVNAHAMPFAGGAIYGATKAAVTGLARGWARDLGPKGILVNVIQPGPIDTDLNPADARDDAIAMTKMTALGRYGRTEEIASLAAFLASDEASYITGTAIDIDGGFSI
jgi:3-oxoacyl-[acyl-carrier protein] reductase